MHFYPIVKLCMSCGKLIHLINQTEIYLFVDNAHNFHYLIIKVKLINKTGQNFKLENFNAFVGYVNQNFRNIF